MPTNNAIDLYIQHQVLLSQYSRGEIQIALKNLKAMHRRVLAQLSDKQRFSFMSKARLETELASITGLLKDGYAAIGKDYSESRESFMLAESEWQQTTLSNLAKNNIAVISLQELVKKGNEFEGKTFNQHLSTLRKRDARAIRTAVLDGVALGRSNREIVANIEQTPALRLARRDIQTLVRTGIQSSSAAVREEYFGQNTQYIEAVYWMSTLDGRTTLLCSSRDGLRYDARTKKPIGHSLPWLDGPPAHFNCRSVSVPDIVGSDETGRRAGVDYSKQTKSNAKSAIRVDKDGRNITPLDKYQRGSGKTVKFGKGRQYSVKTDFETWFKQQPAWFQDEYLGPAKAKLYRKGGLKLGKFSEKNGKALSLNQLKKRYPKQWKSAFDTDNVVPIKSAPRASTASKITASRAAPNLGRSTLTSQKRPKFENHGFSSGLIGDEGKRSPRKFYNTRMGKATAKLDADPEFNDFLSAFYKSQKMIDDDGPRNAYSLIADASEAWNYDPTSQGANIIRHFVNLEFGAGAGRSAAYKGMGDKALEKFISGLSPSAINGGRKLVRQIYENTQSTLRANGIKKLTLARGMRLRGEEVKGMFGSLPKNGFKFSSESASQNSVSSWTTHFDTAEEFAQFGSGMRGTNHYAYFQTEVDASKIWSMPGTGPGVSAQQEYLVLGSADDKVSGIVANAKRASDEVTRRDYGSWMDTEDIRHLIADKMDDWYD